MISSTCPQCQQIIASNSHSNYNIVITIHLRGNELLKWLVCNLKCNIACTGKIFTAYRIFSLTKISEENCANYCNGKVFKV